MSRVRCKECGSTRVSGIVLGYSEGRLAVDDEGRVYVDAASGASNARSNLVAVGSAADDAG